MADTCLFCRLVRGETSAAVVYEDAATMVFLDHRPLFPGHCLVIPKEHTETLSDLPDGGIEPLFRTAKAVARAVEDALQAEGTFVAINNRVSQSVPHLHVHVVPRRKKDGLRGFFWPRTKYDDADAMERMRQTLQAALAGAESSAE